MSSTTNTTADVKAKSNSVITMERTGAILKLTVLGAGSVLCDTAKLAQGVRDEAFWFGLGQRLSNRAAINRDPKTGKSATPATKLEAINKLNQHWMSGGAWELPKGEGGAVPMVVRAFMRVKECDEEQARLRIKRYAEEKFAGELVKAYARLKEMTDIRQAILDITAEDLAQGEAAVDADEELDSI